MDRVGVGTGRRWGNSSRRGKVGRQVGGGAGEEAPGAGSRAERGQDIEKEADQSLDFSYLDTISFTLCCNFPSLYKQFKIQ